MALTMAPATESIMGSLPLGKAGVGSAVNDTTRQVGGALGVAVVGSVLASTYGNQVGEFLRGKTVPSGAAAHASSTRRSASRCSAGQARSPASPTAATNGVHRRHARRACSWPRASRFSARSSRSCSLPRPRRELRRPAAEPTTRRRRAGGRPTWPRRHGRDGPSRDRALTDGAAAGVEARRPGRPRSVEADEAILEAAFAVFAECGLRRPDRRGRRGTRRRRQGHDLPPLPRQARPRDRRRVAVLRRRSASRRPTPARSRATSARWSTASSRAHRPHRSAPRCSRCWSRSAAASPSSTAAHDEIIADEARRAAAPSIRRAIERGELRADVDPELVIDCT